jgi:hypothetical protein
MTLASLTALLSRVSRDNPKLLDSREVALFIETCIAEGRKLPVDRAAIAPVDDPSGV